MIRRKAIPKLTGFVIIDLIMALSQFEMTFP